VVLENPSPPESSAGVGSGGDEGVRATAFGRRLRDLRLRTGLSQKQLATSSTLSVRAIRDLENGRVRQPRMDTLRLLSAALGLGVPEMDRLANDHLPGALTREAEPAVGGPFLGREQEVAALTAMLGPKRHRLVTITGIEGVGKTRLALEVASGLETSEGLTVVWLPLDDDRFRGGNTPVGAPERPAWLREVVRSGLDGRRRLVETSAEVDGILVLDGARPEDELEALTTNILAACPLLRILVTTRDPVGMPLDTLFPLAPLPLPSADTPTADLDQVPSVALLLARMKRIQPAFRPDPRTLADVADICRALDGIPAALEVAAHWSLIYSPRQLAHQLDTEPLSVVRRPHGDHRRPEAFASVHRTIAALSRRQRDLLTTMSSETDDYWSVPEAANRMGMTAAECADDVYHLLILGVLRRVDRHDVATFRMLNIVGIAWLTAAA